MAAIEEVRSALVMNSYWAFVPAGIGAVLLVVLTVLEDRFLIEQLPGYAGGPHACFEDDEPEQRFSGLRSRFSERMRLLDRARS